MNEDHAEAVLLYARHYGGIQRPDEVNMISIEPESMSLEVDGKVVQIPFESILKNSEEAHHVLVKMVRDIPK